MDRLINNTSITGKITSGFTFSHEVAGKCFYQMMVAVSRLSRQKDILPVLIPENRTMLDVHVDYTGYTVTISGRYQSYYRIDEKGRHLDLSVYANEISVCNERMVADTNEIFLTGNICKSPVYRETPLGRRITDVLIAVYRCGVTSDYIPCIFWEANAKRASSFEVGAKVEIEGRVQSREYIKKINDSESEKRVAYEVSVKRIL